jgi:hypothetical protein
MFRGRDGASLQPLFKDSLQEIYEGLLFNDNPADVKIPENIYSAINDAMDAA